jgi:hypothetical protein
MKKLLFLLVFIPLVSFGQNDFRKMFFGESKEVLKEKYPDVEFTTSIESDVLVLTHYDVVGGIETTVAYLFVDNSLMAGLYYFDNTNIFKSSSDRYKDYKNISDFLNDKYEMEENNTWHNDSYKDDPNSYDHSLAMGYVDFDERYTTDKLLIRHSVSKSDGVITHILGYSSPSFAELIDAENDSDF